MAGNVQPTREDDLIVSALEMREPLGPRDLAILEPQAGEAVAADRRVAATGRRDERQAADGDRFGSGGHGRHGAELVRWVTWPGGRNFRAGHCAGGRTTPRR